MKIPKRGEIQDKRGNIKGKQGPSGPQIGAGIINIQKSKNQPILGRVGLRNCFQFIEG